MNPIHAYYNNNVTGRRDRAESFVLMTSMMKLVVEAEQDTLMFQVMNTHINEI